MFNQVILVLVETVFWQIYVASDPKQELFKTRSHYVLDNSVIRGMHAHTLNQGHIKQCDARLYSEFLEWNAYCF